jgi:thioesterase domain-containing protein
VIILKKLKIYLETTIFNFYYADDAIDKKQDTIILFEEIESEKYDAYTSLTVIREINEASEEKRKRMLDLISRYGIKVLDDDKEAQQLADVYVKEGVIPVKYSPDAVHIALATFWDMDIIVSWNFKHIVKRKTIVMSNVINNREGYKSIDIYSPTEVIEDVDE